MLLAASNPAAGLLLPVLLVGAMYMLLIRPQQRRARAQQALTRSIQEGDEVVTTSGLYGYVTAIENDVIWLEIAEGVDIRIVRAAVSRKVESSGSAPAGSDAIEPSRDGGESEPPTPSAPPADDTDDSK
jgi:preprotein translocase subunit YajC